MDRLDKFIHDNKTTKRATRKKREEEGILTDSQQKKHKSKAVTNKDKNIFPMYQNLIQS